MRLMICLMGCAISLLTATVARADGASGSGCAERLTPPARQIYGLAAPELKPESNIPDLLRAKARPLVMAGQMDRSTAQSAAQAAGVCLKALRG